MDLNQFAVDPAVYENGKRVAFGAGAHVSVRSAGSERARKVRERLWKPYSTWKDVPQDILDKLNAAWCAQGLLSEMVGFTIDGAPLEVDLSKEDNRVRLTGILEQAKFSAFRGRIIGIAIDDANYQAAVEDAIEGKSAALPAGSSQPAATPVS